MGVIVLKNSSTGTSYNVLLDDTVIPSTTGLLNESAHDALDHSGLTGIPIIPVFTAVSVSTNHTASSNEIIDCDATSNSITITLPTGSAGDSIIIRKIDISSNTVIITGVATIKFQYTALHLIYSTSWGII